MKKLLFLFFTLTVSSYTYSQIPSGLELTDIISIDFKLYQTKATVLTVPEGKFWTFTELNNALVSAVFLKRNGIAEETGVIQLSTNRFITTGDYLNIFIPGDEIYAYISPNADTSINFAFFEIYEFNAPNTQTGTLALNEVKAIDDKMQLFPNPTNSRLSLNSEKDYNIEVFDLTGRKIMEAQGNNLDMSNLSKATYIVKAFDKASKETYSYKVIRN